jgi:hypothetical protein
MAARFQSYIQGSSPGILAGRGQRVHLGVGLAVALVPAFTNKPTIPDHDRTNERVRLNPAPAPLGQLQSTLHPPPVLVVHADILISSRRTFRQGRCLLPTTALSLILERL